MANYWFLVLGIDFDSIPSAEVVTNAITRKANWWNDDLQAIGKYAGYYTMCSEQVPFMRKDLSTPAGIEQHANMAAGISFPVIDRLLNTFVSSVDGVKTLDPAKMPNIRDLAKSEIARSCNLPFVEISDELFERRADTLGIALGRSGRDERATALYRTIALEEPDGLREFRSAEAGLIPLGKRSLYDFACPEGVDDPRKLPADALFAQAHKVLEELQMSPALRSATEKAIPRLESIIGDEKKRDQYDRYLQWRDINEVLDSTGQMATLNNGVMDSWIAEDALKRISNALGDVDKADLVICGYCLLHEPRLTYIRSGEPDDGKSHEKHAEKKQGTISLDVAALNLKVGESKRITVTSSGERFNYRNSNNKVISCKWEKVGDAWTLLVEGLAEGCASIDIELIGDSEQLGCSAPTVGVAVTERQLYQPHLDFTSPNLTMQGAIQTIVVQRGETVPLQIITDTDGTIDARWDNSAILGAQWSQEPGGRTLMLTGQSGGSTILTLGAQQTKKCYSIVPVSVRIDVRENAVQNIESTWKRSGCLGKGCMTYVIYAVIVIVIYAIVMLLGQLV